MVDTISGTNITVTVLGDYYDVYVNLLSAEIIYCAVIGCHTPADAVSRAKRSAAQTIGSSVQISSMSQTPICVQAKGYFSKGQSRIELGALISTQTSIRMKLAIFFITLYTV